MDGQEAFESFKLHHAIRLHFTSESYDYVKFKGKVKLKAESFDKRNDCLMYFMLWKRYKRDLGLFYVSVMISDSATKWAGDLIGGDAHHNFTEMMKRHQQMSKMFLTDVKIIVDFMEDKGLSFKSLLQPDGANMPKIVRLQEQGYINLETLVIINQLTKLTDKCDCHHPFWGDKKLLLERYQPFLKVSKLGKFASVLRTAIDKLG